LFDIYSLLWYFKRMQENELFLRPLFYDALSREFTPLSDPERRSHTLGRLAYAAFVKGDVVTTGFPQQIEGGWSKVYSPSWAPNVNARLDGISVIDPNIASTENSTMYNVKSLCLEANDGNHYLDLIDNTWHEDGTSAMLLATNGSERKLELELGRKLELARGTVVTHALSFFNDVFDDLR
jgi:hypothetical protein